MQIQLIQKKAQIGSQVEFTLMTGNQVSGLLKEISLEHVTLDAAKGEMTILLESIIAVQSLDNINALNLHLTLRMWIIKLIHLNPQIPNQIRLKCWMTRISL